MHHCFLGCFSSHSLIIIFWNLFYFLSI
jgi:hypothetical protein